MSIFTTLLHHEVNIYGCISIALSFGVDPYYLTHFILYEFFDPFPSVEMDFMETLHRSQGEYHALGSVKQPIISNTNAVWAEVIK